MNYSNQLRRLIFTLNTFTINLTLLPYYNTSIFLLRKKYISLVNIVSKIIERNLPAKNMRFYIKIHKIKPQM